MSNSLCLFMIHLDSVLSGESLVGLKMSMIYDDPGRLPRITGSDYPCLTYGTMAPIKRILTGIKVKSDKETSTAAY